MLLTEFIKKSGCEANLARLLGEVIPGAVSGIRTAIESQKGELAGSQNVYGEHQLALDLQANEIVLSALRKSGLVERAASEEMENEVVFAEHTSPQFAVAFDPLDGSSLVDVNFAVGSIFGVYPAGDFLGRTGEAQLASGFAVYGPHTTLVLTWKNGVHEFRLNKDGNYYLIKENLKIDQDAKHFAPGNLRAAAEREDYLRLTNEWIKKGLTLRYSGGMVPDVNHILLKGNGIFTYPGYSKVPEGKLRLLFECNPMALLMEQAGGVALDGKGRILVKKITALHERSPIYLGSTKTVQEAVAKLS